MYPPITCSVCCRSLVIEYIIVVEYRKKFEAEILKDNRYRAYGETVKFPLHKAFDELQLRECCSTEIMTKVDTTHEIYGLHGLP